MAKKIDPKAKAKRQKIIAGVGAVLLLAILAIQVPRTMKMLNGSPPPEPPVAAPATAPGTDPSVLPTPGTAAGAAPAATGGGTLVDSDVPPAPEAGQLVSFGRFASKDPFAAQIDDGGPSGGGGADAAGGGAGSAEPEGGIVGGDAGGSSQPGKAGTAIIAVNGVEEAVAVKSEFPASGPVFVLVSLTRTEAKVAIAGGAFASGAPAVTLRLGKPLTLVNTADGVRYELKLVRTG